MIWNFQMILRCILVIIFFGKVIFWYVDVWIGIIYIFGLIDIFNNIILSEGLD